MCSTLICIQKDPGLFSEEFPKSANAAEMVKIMSVASLFHHEGRIICIYVSSLQYMLSFTLFSFARQYDWKGIEGP